MIDGVEGEGAGLVFYPASNSSALIAGARKYLESRLFKGRWVIKDKLQPHLIGDGPSEIDTRKRGLQS